MTKFTDIKARLAAAKEKDQFIAFSPFDMAWAVRQIEEQQAEIANLKAENINMRETVAGFSQELALAREGKS